MYRKGISILLLVVLLVPLLSGCWDRKEVHHIAFLTSILYDLNENNEQRVVFEVLKPLGLTSEECSESPTIIFVAEGASIPEVLRNSNKSIERELFAGNNQVRFFSEKYAQNDLTDILDFFIRDLLADERPHMIVIKGDDPDMIYHTTLALSTEIGGYIEGLIENETKNTGRAVQVTTMCFMNYSYSEGRQGVTSVVEIVENEMGHFGTTTTSDSEDKKYMISCEGLAVFKDNILVGYLDGDGARAYNIINKKFKESYEYVEVDEAKISLRFDKIKTKIDVTLVDDIPIINIDIKTNISLLQVGSTIDIYDEEDINAIQDALGDKIEGQIIEAINKTQSEYASDIFGFGSILHKNHPKDWKRIKKSWDDSYYPSAQIKVEMKTRLFLAGEVEEPFGRRGNNE